MPCLDLTLKVPKSLAQYIFSGRRTNLQPYMPNDANRALEWVPSVHGAYATQLSRGFLGRYRQFDRKFSLRYKQGKTRGLFWVVRR